MSSIIADNVMAVTHKLVRQAMHGEWQDVPKTVEERRVLLDRLSASATSADQQWLMALKQAVAESDAAVRSIASAGISAEPVHAIPEKQEVSIDATLDMIRQGR